MTEPFLLEPSPVVAGLTAYAPPRPGAPVDLHLDGNEGEAPPAELLQAVLAAGTEALRRYPDASVLEADIAATLGIEPSRVVVTAGGDDALERILRAALAPGREVVLPVPTFEMIERYARLASAEVVHVPWVSGAFPVEAVLAAVTERTAVVTVVSPNSPTGLVATEADLRFLSASAPSALLLVDLAYVELADRDLTGVVLDLPNAIAVRSMSKAWGLAGARVGFAAGPARVAGWLRAVGHPYAVSSPSLALAAARWRTGREGVTRFASRIRQERADLAALIAALGGRCEPSQANFVLGRFRDAAWVRDGLAAQGIGVRIFPAKPYLGDALRITLPADPGAYSRLARGLETALRPEAVVVTEAASKAGDSHALAALTRRLPVGVLVAEPGYPSDPDAGRPSEAAVVEGLRGLLAKLRVDRAWVVATDEAAVRAARAEGLLPLGITDCGGASADALIRAGAGRVLSDVTEIQELLP